MCLLANTHRLEHMWTKIVNLEITIFGLKNIVNKLPEQSSPVNPSLHLQVFPGNRVLTVVQFSCEGSKEMSTP